MMTNGTQGAKARRSYTRRPWLWVGAAISVVAVSGAAWFYLAQKGKANVNYILATVQRGDVEDLVSATGSLQPRDYVDVGAMVSGQLRKLHVQVGSEVQAGDLLAEIDAETSSAKVEASRAQIRALQAQLAQNQVALAKAERDLQRQRNLMADEATTTETLQNAQSTLDTTRAQVQALQAQIDQLRASSRVDEANLKFTKIYAPMSGTVVSITARQGQTLNANQTAPTLLRVADLSAMTVQTQVSEADVSKLRRGMVAYFTTLGSQGRRWYGELQRIEPTPTVTNNVVLYNALFDVPNANRNLMTQMTAQVFFVVAEARDVLVVPMSALTVQRGTGQRGERAPGQGPRGSAPSSTPSAAPSAAPALRGGSSSLWPQEGFMRVADTASDGAATGRPRMDREAFQKLSDEEKQRLREQWRKARESGEAPAEGWGRPSRREGEAAPRESGANGGSGGSSARDGRGPAAVGEKAPAAEKAARNDRGSQREKKVPNAKEADGKASSNSQRAEGVPARTPRGPRQAKVKVMTEDGQIEEREITIGVSNRVHAEVLSGLKEGDRVIAGVREPETQRKPAQQGGLGQAGAGMPGMPPGAGMGGGAASGSRR